GLGPAGQAAPPARGRVSVVVRAFMRQSKPLSVTGARFRGPCPVGTPPFRKEAASQPLRGEERRRLEEPSQRNFHIPACHIRIAPYRCRQLSGRMAGKSLRG